MPTLTIESKLYEELEKAAQAEGEAVQEITTEALRHYLWRQSFRKISREFQVYKQRHPELKDKYLGRYIAMHNGEVVDDDVDFQALYRRIRKRYGSTPVLIIRVEESPEVTLTKHGFSLGRNVLNRLRLLLSGPDLLTEVLF